MIKRISALLILDGNQVVNSYNFGQHLPVGKLKYTMQRLQEFEVDEINILNTSHSNSPVNDLNHLLTNIGEWHISTPLAYGGGISSLEEAIKIIKSGVERVIVSARTFFDINLFENICDNLGDQAVILHLPLEFKTGTFSIRGYESKTINDICDLMPKKWGGEILLSLVENDGQHSPNWKVINDALINLSFLDNIILAGGFANGEDIVFGLSLNQVTAISIGNYLHRVENSIIKIKNNSFLDLQVRK